MLGLGETDDELKEAMADLRAIDVDILTLGQYLQVSNMVPGIQPLDKKWLYWFKFYVTNYLRNDVLVSAVLSLLCSQKTSFNLF